MAEGFEVGHARGELDEQTRHALVAAQLRGEEKARGRDPEAVIAAVAEEIRALGLEPDRDELERRYAAIDPDLPLTRDTEDEVTGDEATGDEATGDEATDRATGAPEGAPGPDPQVRSDLVSEAEMTPTPTGDEPRRSDGT